MMRWLMAGVFLLSGVVLAGAPVLEPPPKPPAGFFQVITPAFNVESDVSKAHAEKVAAMVRTAEQKFYTLFKLTPDLMNGVSKQKFDMKANIPGDILNQWGFRSFVEVRVYKDMETFADVWFESTGVNDKQQRLRQGIPGAWFSIRPDYDKSKTLRQIRTFVGNRDDDELERTLLHEMGHLFMQTYLLEFGGGGGKPGEEAQKRGTPAWLGEGVAQLFELHWSKAGSAGKAKNRQQAMIYEATLVGDSYPFEEFVNITNAHNLAAVAGNPLKSTLNYAQSASVMDYMVNVDGQRFFSFLENLRALNFEKNLRNPDKNHVRELYSFQNEAFKKAFVIDIAHVEAHWKKHIKTTMEKELKAKPELNYWIGEYYLRRHKDDSDLTKAEEKFKLAMTLAPQKGEGYLGYGRMQMRKKDFEGAAKTLADAVKFMPKDDDAWYYYALAQSSTGLIKEAIESFNQSLKIFPRNHRAQAGLGLVAVNSGQFELAMQAYDQAYQIARHPVYLLEKGQAAYFAKKYKEAQSSFAPFCEVFPNDGNGQMWYGLAAWRLGDKEFAMTKLKEAAKLSPANPTIKEALTRAEKGEVVHFEREDAAPAVDPKAPPVKVKPIIIVEEE